MKTLFHYGCLMPEINHMNTHFKHYSFKFKMYFGTNCVSTMLTICLNQEIKILINLQYVMTMFSNYMSTFVDFHFTIIL